MSWLVWLRVVAVTVVLIPFVQMSTRFWAERSQPNGGGRHLRLLESLSLGSDGRIYLVEVAGRVYAFLSGAKGFEVIGEVEAPDLLTQAHRGEGVRGDGLAMPSYLTSALAAATSLWHRLAEGREAGSGALDEDGNRTVELLQAQLVRARQVGRAGDEALAVGKQ